MAGSYLDRLFVQEFTAFYCRKYLNGDYDQFNYEKFYDFISDFLGFKIEKIQIDSFCDSFNDAYVNNMIYSNDSYNWVWRLKRILNQLIADLLNFPKYYESVGYSNYPSHGAFFGSLRELLKDNTVNIHTFNHDLFFDFTGEHLTDLWQHFTDGYTEYGSTIYGQISTDFKTDRGNVHKTYNVRLKWYNGEYNNKLRLFKLHGSIDSYILRLQNSQEEIRIKKDYGVREFLMERYEKDTGKYKYEMPFTDTYPDFLSGTTEKIRQYNIPFYESLFNHFKDNLLASSKLIVIGYGFQDKGINDYLEKYYLIYRKPMIVIDVKKTDSELIRTYEEQIHFMLKGINGYHYEEFLSEVAQ